MNFEFLLIKINTRTCHRLQSLQRTISRRTQTSANINLMLFSYKWKVHFVVNVKCNEGDIRSFVKKRLKPGIEALLLTSEMHFKYCQLR